MTYKENDLSFLFLLALEDHAAFRDAFLTKINVETKDASKLEVHRERSSGNSRPDGVVRLGKEHILIEVKLDSTVSITQQESHIRNALKECGTTHSVSAVWLIPARQNPPALESIKILRERFPEVNCDIVTWEETLALMEKQIGEDDLIVRKVRDALTLRAVSNDSDPSPVVITSNDIVSCLARSSEIAKGLTILSSIAAALGKRIFERVGSRQGVELHSIVIPDNAPAKGGKEIIENLGMEYIGYSALYYRQRGYGAPGVRWLWFGFTADALPDNPNQSWGLITTVRVKGDAINTKRILEHFGSSNVQIARGGAYVWAPIHALSPTTEDSTVESWVTTTAQKLEDFAELVSRTAHEK